MMKTKTTKSNILLWGLTLTFLGGILSPVPADAREVERTIHMARGVYNKGDEIDLSGLLFEEHNISSRVCNSMLQVELEVWNELGFPQSKLALYINNQKVAEGEIQSSGIALAWMQLKNQNNNRSGRNWRLLVTHGSVHIGDVLLLMNKGVRGRKRAGRSGRGHRCIMF